MSDAKEIKLQRPDLWKVVGIAPYTKNGNTSYNLHLVGYFTDYDEQNGAVGLKTAVEWTRLDCGFLNIGDVVELRYAKGFQGLATLSDVIRYPDIKNEGFGCSEIYVQSQDVSGTVDVQPGDKKGKNA